MKENPNPRWSESAFYFVYRWFAWPVLRFAFSLLALFVPKIAKGLELRKPLNGRAPWRKLLPPSAPTVWFHCASGEFEYAKPVISALKLRSPETKVVVSYFSPTYADNIRKFAGVDWVVPLPWDSPRPLNEFMDSYRPSALLIARTDVWPEMARQAHLRGLKTALFSASLTSGSGRMRGVGRWATRASMNQLDQIFCVSEEDAANFRALGLTHAAVTQQGDTRYDQVLARLRAPKPIRADLFEATRTRDVFVCGSTWPEDEAVLVPALGKLANALSTQQRSVLGILVPHEPTASHLARLSSQIEDHGLSPVLYSDLDASEKLRAPNSCLIIDQVGILAELYLKARWAFVGGSFKKNVHSVMEPLAAGCLTLVGPHHANNREALAFRKLKTANPKFNFVNVVQSANELVHAVRELQTQPSPAADISAAVREKAGSSDVLVTWLLNQD